MSLAKTLNRGLINSSIKKVSRAREACASAGQAILSPQSEIRENWHGDAATAMNQALNDVWKEIQEAYECLQSAESAVQAQGNYIINNWTDEESE